MPDSKADPMPGVPAHLDRLAHDLRGPLSPLQTAAYLLRRDDLDETRRHELADIVQRQTSRLSGMIDEVGDWIRAGQSRLVRRREPTELGLLLDLVCATGAATRASVQPADWQLEPGLDQAIVGGDPQRLAQMLGILIAHARSRIGDGEIRLSGHRHGDGVRLCVTGHGPPLPPDELAALFDAPQVPPLRRRPRPAPADRPGDRPRPRRPPPCARERRRHRVLRRTAADRSARTVTR